MRAIQRSQPEFGRLMRLVALSCIVLALFMSGLEAMHAHSDAAASSNSSPCVICLSAHANTPVVTVYLLSISYAVEAVAVPYESEGKSAISDLALFIRPPPVA
jgi:hypothetical protein